MQNDVLSEELVEKGIEIKQKRIKKRLHKRAVLLTIIEAILLFLEIVGFVGLGVLNVLVDDIISGIIFVTFGLLLISLFANCLLFLINVLILKKNIRDIYYGFDYLEEMQIYKNIGISTRRKKARYKNPGCVHFICYSEWETYIKDKYKLRINEIDFYHYVTLLSRSKKDLLDSIKAVIIPVEIAMISGLASFGKNTEINKFSIIILSVFCVIYFALEIEKNKIESDFFEDFIDIVFPKLSGK